jgi:hypothetical protein
LEAPTNGEKKEIPAIVPMPLYRHGSDVAH